MIGSFGWSEGLIILAIVIVIFGVGKLGDVGGALGKSVREFRKAASEPLDSDTNESKSSAEEGESKASTSESQSN